MQHIEKPTKRQYHFAKNTQEAKDQAAEQTVTVSVSSNKMSSIVVKVNVIRPICSLMFGRNHSAVVRMLSGAFIAGLGVVFAKYVGHAHNEVIAHLGGGVGYGLHALGLTPFIEFVANKFE